MKNLPRFENLLGRDRKVPENKKLIMTDLALDTWIASHYDVQLDSIPKRVYGVQVNKEILKRMKKTYKQKLEIWDDIVIKDNTNEAELQHEFM